MESINDTILVGYNYIKEKDNAVLVVGRQIPKTTNVQIINAFQGEEATALYNKLITKKGENNG